MKTKNILLLGVLMFCIFLMAIAVMEEKGTSANDNSEDILPVNSDLDSSNESDISLKYIPGLTAVDVYGNFEDIGFVIEKNFSSDLKEWICTLDDRGVSYRVTVLGDSPLKILSVTGIAILTNTNSDISISKDFFNYLCSIPYDRSNSALVQNWLSNNFNSSSSKVVSGVTFSIRSPTKVSKLLTVKVD